MKKACFIIPYFGRFPNYFPLWLNSAKYNSEFDFYFLTDIILTSQSPPDNVFFVTMSKDDIITRIKATLGIEPMLLDAYKLCDFRPAYGVLFPEIIKKYPFWGYIDIDMIFGDLSLFLKDEIFNQYDKIGKQGHLTLFRNCDKCNNLFLTDSNGKYVDYFTVFQSKHSFHFDESGLIAHADAYGIRLCGMGEYYDVMPHKFPFLVINPSGGFSKCITEFRGGKLYLHYIDSDLLKHKEVLYVHFQKRTMSVADDLNLNNYFAIPNQFISDRNIDITYVKEVNKDRIYFEWYKKRLKMIVTNIKNGALYYRFSQYKL